MANAPFLTWVVVVFLAGPNLLFSAPAVHMANGVKIGEVTQDSARVWTRLTRSPERTRSNWAFLPTDRSRFNDPSWDGTNQLPFGLPLDAMDGAVPGAAGEVRLVYWLDGDVGSSLTTPWEPVDLFGDFTRQVSLTDLRPGSPYRIRAEGRALGADDISVSIDGSFRTAPSKTDAEEIQFAVVTCGDYSRRDDPVNGHQIYQVLAEEIQPDFLVHAGDIEYFDKPEPWAPSVALARFKFNRLYAMPNFLAFHNHFASYWMKDDHDTLRNDCWPGQHFGSLTWEEGLAVFPEQFPVSAPTYRTFRWGKDLQIWLMEGRDYRSPNRMPDGPAKTIWGVEQKRWLFETMQYSDATFRVLLSPTPIVGPDRESKNDNHANRGFELEGTEVRQFLSAMDNTIVICGDRHWQYASVDDETGLREFACGPSSNEHAGGFPNRPEPEHRYLRIGGGFLTATVSPEGPTLTVRHHDVKGVVQNETVIQAEPGFGF